MEYLYETLRTFPAARAALARLRAIPPPLALFI